MKKIALLLALIMALMVIPAAFAEDDVVTLKVFSSSPKTVESWDWGKDPLTAYITEQTGIALDITSASTNDHTEFYTMLASGVIDEYDMLWLGKYEPTLVEDEYVLALNDLADEYCPEWYDVISADEIGVHSINGKVYYTTSDFADAERMNTLMGGKKAFSMFYNYQAFDALGIDPATIQTLDDVEATAIRLRDELGINYPIYLNSYGITSNIDYAQILSGSFAAPGVVYPQEDGTVTYNVKSAEYKAALEWLNKMYKEGLIKAENFTFTNAGNDESVKNIAQKGDVGFVLGHMWQINQHRPEGNGGGIHGNGAMGLLQFAGVVPTAEGVSQEDIKLSDNTLSDIGTAQTYVLASTDHPAECIRFIAYMFTDEIQRQLIYGREGVAWTLEYNDIVDAEILTQTEEYKEDQTKLTTEELKIKYGDTLFYCYCSKYANNWTSVPEIIIVEEDGTRKQYGEMLVSIGMKYGTPFKTGSLTMNLTDADEVLLNNNVKDAWKNNLPQCVMADDFEAAYAKLISEMETVGLGELEKIFTERYWAYDEILQETRNDKWNEAAGR